jgi:hypothetical protein
MAGRPSILPACERSCRKGQPKALAGAVVSVITPKVAAQRT